MKDILGAKKTIPLIIAILILSFITLFLVVEFRFLQKNMGEYEEAIQGIAAGKTRRFLEDIRLFTENWAFKAGRREIPRISPEAIAAAGKKVTNVYVLDPRGRLKDSLKDNDLSLPGKTLGRIKRGGEAYIFVAPGKEAANSLLAAAPVGNEGGLLVVEFKIIEFKKEIYQEFTHPGYKMALFDNKGRAVIWPFPEKELERFNPRNKQFKSGDIQFKINKIALQDTSLALYFFSKDQNFDTYRILTIMFLLFGLYFCIYQFLVEFWQATSARSYYENIDFDILNHLKEGIIISNRFNRVIFANKAAHDFLTEKEIVLKKSNLKDILGQIGESNKKFTLKKSDKSLEIIRSPIFKNGKMLGSLVVISESVEKEKLCTLMFAKITELLKDGIIFVGKDNEINSVNMMARYYLGKVEPGMNISDVNSDLAAAIYQNMRSGSLKRVQLPENNLLCELFAVSDDSGSYAGTLVFVKNAEDYGE